jgi:sugar O-acyltransferase (sialic acid O-acetyltransferase NeuD family)
MDNRIVYIIGGGGHAHVIASFLIDRTVRFIVPIPEQDDQISATDFFAGKIHTADAEVYIGIGNNSDREREYNKIVELGLRIGTCIAPNAFVARDATLGPGTVICAGAVVGARAVVGANSIVNTLASIDHDCALGDHSHIAPGVTVAGTVRIGSRCFLGLKSGVFPNLTIGDDVVVMAGALVTRSVSSGLVVGGIPARTERGITPGDGYHL